MKIRSGFVSNSSSSSFVVIGCSLPKKLQKRLAEKLGVDVETDDWMYDGILTEKFGMEVISTEDSVDGGYVFGKVLVNVSSDGEYMERKTITFNEMREMKNKLHDILGDDLDVNVALHIGTRPS